MKNVFKVTLLLLYLVIVPMGVAVAKTDTFAESEIEVEEASAVKIGVKNIILDVTEKCIYLEYDEASVSLLTLSNWWRYAPSKLTIYDIQSIETSVMLVTYTKLIDEYGIHYKLATYGYPKINSAGEQLVLTCEIETPVTIVCNCADFTIID